MNSNWVKVFNDLERDKQGEILGLIDNLEKVRADKFNDISVEIYTLSEEADNVEFFDLETIALMDKIDYLHNKFNNMILKYDEKIKDIDIEVDSLIDKVNEIIKSMQEQARNFLTGNSSKYTHNVNFTIVRNRLFVFRKRMIHLLNEFLDYDTGLNSEIDYTRDTIQILKRQAMKRVKRESDALEKSIKENKKKSKIFDYKEMNRLAKLKGFETTHCNGSHMILRHIDSKKSIVVPQHSIGKGLSFKIQKQMKDNSINIQ